MRAVLCGEVGVAADQRIQCDRCRARYSEAEGGTLTLIVANVIISRTDLCMVCFGDEQEIQDNGKTLRMDLARAERTMQ